jgi:hypothetical protein
MNCDPTAFAFFSLEPLFANLIHIEVIVIHFIEIPQDEGHQIVHHFISSLIKQPRQIQAIQKRRRRIERNKHDIHSIQVDHQPVARFDRVRSVAVSDYLQQTQQQFSFGQIVSRIHLL